ncbi:DUF423 domain-containing protein [Winogradskyella litoriviva]|uniref:DUF423 domain-containing protein n=1 Tax=Winogradskyella litoriviva TaxID=1220182 RepID=A0ABX2E099_9FLAO|nr:DUF423 domain-containing protein [Winogradskyella litoriviva]NRD21917.1 DUF423 domain-containing protein [Winogradskyella litoriviva]
MNKKLLITGTILGIIGIVLGAFAAHGLTKLIDADAIKTFETGVRYQMYHAFFLLILGGTTFVSLKTKKILFYLVICGVIFFSGSIYGLATNMLTTFNFKTIALITPVGGLLLILSWIVMLVDIIRNKVD